MAYSGWNFAKKLKLRKYSLSSLSLLHVSPFHLSRFRLFTFSRFHLSRVMYHLFLHLYAFTFHHCDMKDERQDTDDDPECLTIATVCVL